MKCVGRLRRSSQVRSLSLSPLTSDLVKLNGKEASRTGLYVGPFQPSWKLEILQGLGITHILCIAESREAYVLLSFHHHPPRRRADVEASRVYRHLVRPKFPDQFQYMIQEIRDADDQNLIRIFPQFADTFLYISGILVTNE